MKSNCKNENTPRTPSTVSDTGSDAGATVIHASVSQHLTNADLLYDGPRRDEIYEVLQAVRQAGATRVKITNTAATPGSTPATTNTVTVRGDGPGTANITRLLNLSDPPWPDPDDEDQPEISEDPASVGLFSFAHRPVTVRSRGLIAVIPSSGLTGADMEVKADPSPVKDTQFEFEDKPWDAGTVNHLAVFSGMDVVVNGEPCPKEPFIPGDPAPLAGPGYKISVVTKGQRTHWHRRAAGCDDRTNVLVNLHGQVIGFEYRPISRDDLVFLVDLPGEPTDLRLVLPARTKLVHNEAFVQLQAALERAAFLYVLRAGKHTLPFKEYLRAKQLGIKLPEAEPTYEAGLLHRYWSRKIEAPMPKGHPLRRCYRMPTAVAQVAVDPRCRMDAPEDQEDARRGVDQTNAHLLAALGTPRSAGSFDGPFVPVTIGDWWRHPRDEYNGYSWAKLPTIDKVEVFVGKTLCQDWFGRSLLICVSALAISAHTSDGKTFSAPVCMAEKPPTGDENSGCACVLYVTPEARHRLQPGQLWHHLGRWNVDGDSREAPAINIAHDLNLFWARLPGTGKPRAVAEARS